MIARAALVVARCGALAGAFVLASASAWAQSNDSASSAPLRDGIAAYRAGDLVSAEKTFRTYAPGDPDAEAWLGAVLLDRGQSKEAMKVLQKLNYNGHNEEWIQQEFLEMKQTIAAEKAITVPGWKIMFTVPAWRTRLLHGVAVQVFTQLSGISTFYHCLDCLVENLLTFSRCHWLLPSYYV